MFGHDGPAKLRRRHDSCPCMETGLDLRNEAPTIAQPSNTELMTTLVVLTLANFISDGMTPDKIQVNIIARE